MKKGKKIWLDPLKPLPFSKGRLMLMNQDCLESNVSITTF